jgi:hypothetical protein
MMKKSFILLCVLMIIVITTTISKAASNESEIIAATQNFFNLLKQGNSVAIQSLLDDDLLQKRNKLFSNPKYEQFLKNYYKDSELKIVSINQVNDSMALVDIEILTKGQPEKNQTICFSKKGNKWKLAREKHME